MPTVEEPAGFVKFSRAIRLSLREYDKKQVPIPVALELPKMSLGQKCRFTLQLDDIDYDACGDEPDNRSTREFTVSERGSQSYKPENNWRYTIRWHTK